MFADDHNRYILLQQQLGFNWSVDRGTFYVFASISVPCTIFLGMYMILFGIVDKLIYIKSNYGAIFGKDLALHQHRAIFYSNYSQQNIYINIPKNSHSNILQTSNERKIPKLVCYYNFPFDEHSLQIDGIDPYLCTHLNVAFGSIQNNSIYLDDKQSKYLQDIVKLKHKNSDLKILLSIGGADNENGFGLMVKNHTNRKTFIKSILNYTKTYKIDGIDLDWEFPSDNPSFDKNQRMHFTQLLSEIRKNINKQQHYTYLLTVAVAALSVTVDTSYDVAYMNDYVDFINIMTYDYHYFSTITPFTGINAPLYQTPSERFYMATLNINYSSHYWNYMGMDKEKIVVGLPLYGHTFRLRDAENHVTYAPAYDYGKLGTLGFASYPEICGFLQINRIKPIFDMDTFSPYAFKQYEWISFDDEQSLTYKAEFIKRHNFGGAMIYSMNVDDFNGDCNAKERKQFPLITAVKNALNN